MAKPNSTDKTTLSIDVTINQKQQDALLAVGRKEGLRDTQVLGGIATGALIDYAAGGIMLSGDTVSRLQKFLRDPSDEREILRLVESGAKRHGDHTVIEYEIDPVWITPLQDMAASQGRTLHDLVHECLQIAFQQNWFYQMEIPGLRTINLTDADYNRLRQLMGTDQVIGSDLVKLFEGRVITDSEPAFA